MQTVVDMKDIKVFRNRKQILHIGEFRLPAGEMTAVSGPNGAGKSTLLQVIDLLLPYQSGTLLLFGADVQSLDTRQLRRRCGMVFQETLLLNRSVYDNVALPLVLRKMEENEVRRRVAAALAAFRCDHLAERPARRLSGGESQRVCLARSFVYQPELLLLDEPFNALDATTRTAILSDLKTVARQHGMTVLLISHNYNDVLYFADRAVVLQDGVIVQDGHPEYILRHPVNEAVANLVDMDNILPCRGEADGNGVTVRFSNGMEFYQAGQELIGVRTCFLPGDVLQLLEKTAAAATPDWVRAPAVISQVIPGVGTYRIVVEANGLPLTVRVPRQHARELAAGLAVEIGFDPREAHFI